MSEVLSQSQIDALLNAVRAGDKDVNEPKDDQGEKKYRKYDFHSPKKFTKDRIKMLNSVFDTYTRIINTRLNATLHTTCEVEVESIEEQRYYEFSNALSEGDVLAISNVLIEGVEDESPVLYYLSSSLGTSMMDLMLGGDGIPEDDDDLVDYKYTDIELSLYENLMKDMISVMGGGWSNYLNMEFEYQRTEVNPTLVQLIGIDEVVVIVDLRLKFPNYSGRMSICLPAMMLTNMFAVINHKNADRRGNAEEKSEEIFEKLRDSSLEIVAHMPEARLQLSDIYHLNVGDVIDLGQKQGSPIYLNIGGYNWFLGQMGTHNKKMAVKIEDVCYQAERRSE
ncbi:MAG: flagellar motor switch protein FliM [Oscillospiraceae bacterium]|nr:flagellar motor switch protein FliM [Oscillospiraceae bacterium]